MTYQQFTVKDLIEALSKFRPNARVKLVDADTYWTIPTFAVRLEEATEGDIVWIDPCEYSDMER